MPSTQIEPFWAMYLFAGTYKRASVPVADRWAIFPMALNNSSKHYNAFCPAINQTARSRRFIAYYLG
jgi:hypothetical protein